VTSNEIHCGNGMSRRCWTDSAAVRYGLGPSDAALPDHLDEQRFHGRLGSAADTIWVTPAELRELEARVANGDVLAHYITAAGEIAHPEVDSRTMGLRLDDVRNPHYAIAVAAGPDKVPVVRAALCSGLCSVLITDESTAATILETRKGDHVVVRRWATASARIARSAGTRLFRPVSSRILSMRPRIVLRCR
jgi:Putative sugar-binding domain